jgi:hypothetical protein
MGVHMHRAAEMNNCRCFVHKAKGCTLQLLPVRLLFKLVVVSLLHLINKGLLHPFVTSPSGSSMPLSPSRPPRKWAWGCSLTLRAFTYTCQRSGYGMCGIAVRPRKEVKLILIWVARLLDVGWEIFRESGGYSWQARFYTHRHPSSWTPCWDRW